MESYEILIGERPRVVVCMIYRSCFPCFWCLAKRERTFTNHLEFLRCFETGNSETKNTRGMWSHRQAVSSNIAKQTWSSKHFINLKNSQVIDKGPFRIRKTLESFQNNCFRYLISNTTCIERAEIQNNRTWSHYSIVIVWGVGHLICDISLADAHTAGQLSLWAPPVEIDLVIM